jgi:hypothetical protein
MTEQAVLWVRTIDALLKAISMEHSGTESEARRIAWDIMHAVAEGKIPGMKWEQNE